MQYFWRDFPFLAIFNFFSDTLHLITIMKLVKTFILFVKEIDHVHLHYVHNIQPLVNTSTILIFIMLKGFGKIIQ